MSEPERPHEIVIIRRSHDDDHDAHHGGVWKIAFADFMTAMMAFFLVLWIVNSSSKETRSSIALYFNPVQLTNSTAARKGLQDPKKTGFRCVPYVERQGARGKAERGQGRRRGHC